METNENESKNSTIQLPLTPEEQGEPIVLTLAQIRPVDELDSQEPSAEMIQSVATYGVPPIIVCPDVGKHKGLYYPVDGKRRIKALHALIDMGYTFDGVSPEDYKISATLRNDLTPGKVGSHRLAFIANNVRSSNAVTDLTALRSAIKKLKADPQTSQGRSELARYLLTTPQTIGKLAKYLVLKDETLDAYQNGDISRDVLKEIVSLTSLKDRDEVQAKVAAGEPITKKDVESYKKATQQTNLVTAMTSRPDVTALTYHENPLDEAIRILEDLTGPADAETIETVLVLLRQLR